MKRLALLIAVAAVIALASPAVAGEKGDCKHDPADCAAKMAKKIQQSAWLGVELEEADNGRLRITRVVDGSPAQQAGFEAGDVLLKFNGIAYAEDNHDKIKKEWYSLKPGATADYVIQRDGRKTKVSATLATVPDAVLAQWVGKHVIEAHTDVKLASK